MSDTKTDSEKAEDGRTAEESGKATGEDGTGTGAKDAGAKGADTGGRASASVDPRHPINRFGGGRVVKDEPDHAGVKAAREEADKQKEQGKAKRAESRKRIKSGNLSGAWIVVGSSLVNADQLTRVELPAENDENPTLTLHTFGGGSVTATGDEARELMEELGLTPLPAPDAATNTRGDVNEAGRIVTPADRAAERIPGRIQNAPTGTHRANAVGTDAETDHDVSKRAGGAAIPPTREFGPLPSDAADRGTGPDHEDGERAGRADDGERAGRSGEESADDKDGEGDADDKDATGKRAGKAGTARGSKSPAGKRGK